MRVPSRYRSDHATRRSPATKIALAGTLSRGRPGEGVRPAPIVAMNFPRRGMPATKLGRDARRRREDSLLMRGD